LVIDSAIAALRVAGQPTNTARLHRNGLPENAGGSERDRSGFFCEGQESATDETATFFGVTVDRLVIRVERRGAVESVQIELLRIYPVNPPPEKINSITADEKMSTDV
jgi:hypothetical protein